MSDADAKARAALPLSELAGLRMLDGWRAYEGPRRFSAMLIGLSPDHGPGHWQAITGGKPPMHQATSRAVLPLVVDSLLEIDERADIVARPQSTALKPTRLTISGGPAGWVFHDIRVGNRSQLAGVFVGGLPADLIADTDLSFETIQTAMDFRIEVRNVGTGKPNAALVRLDGQLYQLLGDGTARRRDPVFGEDVLHVVKPRLVMLNYQPVQRPAGIGERMVTVPEMLTGIDEATGATVLTHNAGCVFVDPNAEAPGAPPMALEQP